MSTEAKIWIAIGVVVVGVMGAIFALGNRSNTPPSGSATQNVTRTTSHRLGSGKVVVVEFGDYECPACEAAYPITKQILAKYGPQITFVFRNFPLAQHPNAPEAAEAAEAAAAQGKFWQMHDKLYDTQNDWANLPDPTNNFVTYAQDLGLDVNTFKTAVQNKAYASVISQDQTDGTNLNITGTPTFYINSQAAADYSYNTLAGMIDSAIKTTK